MFRFGSWLPGQFGLVEFLATEVFQEVGIDLVGDSRVRSGARPNRPIIWHHDFLYQAASWDTPRRVVAKIEWHKGELFPRVGFIVTNQWRPAWRVVRFYNGRGTAEQWIKEGKNAVKWTRLSCHDFVDNQVRLQLFTLAYNLGNPDVRRD